VPLGQNVPIHSPMVAAPVAGLCGRFGWLVDAACFVRALRSGKENIALIITHAEHTGQSSPGAP
jgi:hypothetical protein